ncbi:DUF1810 domain-containing protein [Acuticoccus sp. I52.16.1]|uniref:DUF1810 domain-containing protein n=1 Tax=Acuticoccus sp. I52.16.1 TaxID=2928472 RepID=UPI001FD05582|nr:DUF1810 domain-containing protein [Acuticoccus sp. I52.16.1]UOM33411.1 DUF1810 domain-containing protein [Acuticoccus sp. I52.16.1]
MAHPLATNSDPFALRRFVDAQRHDYATALRELQNGAKRTHWIWYVFPQHAALGVSLNARRYGIVSLGEARAYLAHPVLGPRLIEACEAALASGVGDAHRLFGSPDDMKVRSSLTLFLAADPTLDAPQRALRTFYGGQSDEKTLALLADEMPRAHAGRS